MNNNSQTVGGAIYGSVGSLINCTFRNNSAQTVGGAIYSIGGPVINCTFEDNNATDAGAVYLGPGTTTVMVNCLFTGNIANENGGALYSFGFGIPGAPAEFSLPVLANCTLVDNVAGVAGSAVYSFLLSWPTILNSILWNSGPDELVGPMGDVMHCNVQGGYGGSGNISSQPEFVDPTGGDYRLPPGSPGIDAGHNNAAPADVLDFDADGDTHECIPLDLDGNPRFAADELDYDPGCGLGAVVDMGAYELPGSPVHPVIVGDLDGSGDVTVTDLLALLAVWGPADECVMADTDIDGVVGAADLLTLLAHWS